MPAPPGSAIYTWKINASTWKMNTIAWKMNASTGR